MKDIFGRETKQVVVSTAKRVAVPREGSSRSRKNVSIRTEEGDCLEIIPRLVEEGIVCDSVVCDPPYHLTSTLARFGNIDINADTATSRRLRQKLDGAARLAHGFMNQKWDGGDIAFRPETWATIASILRPGAFLVAFGGTRTHHRVWCAIEDAGFVIQDTIMWLFGSGFPKRRDMLKPAFEPIVLAYKPGGKRTPQVDECRISTTDDFGDPSRWVKSREHAGWDRPGHTDEHKAARSQGAIERAQTLGRWPANVCHDGSEEVTEAFAAFGDRPGAVSNGRKGVPGLYKDRIGPAPQVLGFGDTGSAARFFYCAKADKDERQGSSHPTVKPVELMQWLVRLVTPYDGLVLDPFAGTGSTGAAAYLEGVDSILIERDPTYAKDLRRKIEEFKMRRMRTLY